jgi:hypothetical protein
MRKAVIIAGALAMALLLGGCSMPRSVIVIDKREADGMAVKIVSALDAGDKEALRSLFSPKALAEADDLDEGLAYIMETYRGTLISFESPGNVIQDHYGAPGRTKTILGYYYIDTEAMKYILYFEYQVIDKQDPKAVGLTYIKLFDSDLKKRSEERRYSTSYGRAGIYHPGWDRYLKGQDG